MLFKMDYGIRSLTAICLFRLMKVNDYCIRLLPQCMSTLWKREPGEGKRGSVCTYPPKRYVRQRSEPQSYGDLLPPNLLALAIF